MELIGKCAIDFIYWYARKMDIHKLTLVQFRNMPDNIQWGVYQDFFTQKGYRPSIIDNYPYYNVQFSLYDGDIIGNNFKSESLSETRKECIKMGMHLYNRDHKVPTTQPTAKTAE